MITRHEADRNGENAENARLDRLVDEALGETMQPPALDLKVRLMAAWDARSDGRRAADDRRRSTGVVGRGRGWTPALLRPSVALAATLSILIGGSLAWQYTRGVRPSEGQRAARSHAPIGPGDRPAPPAGREETPAKGATKGTGAGPEQTVTDPASRRVASSVRRSRSNLATVEFPVEDVSASAQGPYLPGAPAGELGDPLEPLPRAPAISIAPIVPGATVSEMARPVSAFPADDQQPGTGEPEPDTSRGVHR